MKPKIFLAFLAVAFTACFISCKKEASSSTDSTTEVTNQSDDQSRVSSETDDVSNDADLAMESSTYFSARPGSNQSLFCDATIAVDTTSDPRTITITYDGTNCIGTRTRTGVVVLSMPAGVHWKDAGATVTLTYQNLHITRVSDNKSITINGSHTVTNVSGGLLYNLPNLGTITHRIASSGITVTFDDNTSRTWHIEKLRTFTYDNGLVISTTGSHTDGANTTISEWGTNRAGHDFTTSTVAPIVVRQDCSFRIVSGAFMHTAPAFTATATFGLDASGNPTGCPGAGHYYFEVVWTGIGGNSHTVILPY